MRNIETMPAVGRLHGAQPEYWRVARIGEPPAPAAERRFSRTLLSWLKRLRDPGPSPYQVCLAMHMAAAEDGVGRRTR
ncbi:MAG TPA: hypothetical protein VFA12_13230 [Stellaceae bacterium]|nr:hypothetical protein [Stellaceae bacterium]